MKIWNNWMKFVADCAPIGATICKSTVINSGLCLFLISCSYLPEINLSNGKDVEYIQDPRNPGRMITKADAKKTGKLNLFNFNKEPEKPEGFINKNYFLWSACLDVLSELPPKISDAQGGLYVTDYVPNRSGDLQAIKCRVTGKKVLSNNLEISVFTKKKESSTIITTPNSALKSNILIRARELKAQYDETI